LNVYPRNRAVNRYPQLLTTVLGFVLCLTDRGS
jgi:hypothetical protein